MSAIRLLFAIYVVLYCGSYLVHLGYRIALAGWAS